VKAAPGQYTLLAVHDDVARVYLDGQLVINGRKANHKDSAVVQLTGAMQEVKVEYVEFKGQALAGLGWKPPGAKHARAVPPSFLFHEPPPPAAFPAEPAASGPRAGSTGGR
jgi:hypothetical protein